MDPAQSYILNYQNAQGEVMQYLHDLLVSYPDITPKIRYKVPFYFRKSWLCYLNPTKNDQVEFAFPRGNELSNHQGLLESKGRKQVLSVTFSKLSEISVDTMNEIIQEAILLDDTVPYASKRKK